MEMSKPPWNPQQVEFLNGFQESGVLHSFTCPNDGNETHDGPGTETNLVAHEDGWHCPHCEYRQEWAHSFMADGLWVQLKAAQDSMFDSWPASSSDALE